MLDLISQLLPAQFEILLARLRTPPHFLSGTGAPQAIRATELVRWAQQTPDRLEALGRALSDMSVGNQSHSTSPTTDHVSDATPCATQAEDPMTDDSAFSIEFPISLLEACKQKKLAILFGSGLSLGSDVEGNFPRWNELPARLISYAETHGALTREQARGQREALGGEDYLSLEVMLAGLDVVKTALHAHRLYGQAIDELFRPHDIRPGDVHHALVELGVQLLVTTNYDQLVEFLEGSPNRSVYTWKRSDKVLTDIRSGRKVLFKIHGDAEDDDSIVMTQSDYEKVRAHVSYQRVMSLLLQNYTFLFVGYGVNDPLDLDLIFQLNSTAFKQSTNEHYVFTKNPSHVERNRLQRDFNIRTVPYSNHSDIPKLLRALKRASSSQ